MNRYRSAALFPLFLLIVVMTAGGLMSSPGGVASAPGGDKAGPPGNVWRPAPGAPAFVDGEVLVGFNASARAQDRANERANLGAASVRRFRSGAEHWRLGPGVSVGQAIDRLKLDFDRVIPIHYPADNRSVAKAELMRAGGRGN